MRNRRIRPEVVMRLAEEIPKKHKRKPVPKDFLEKFLEAQKKSNSGTRDKRSYYWGSDKHQMNLPLNVSED